MVYNMFYDTPDSQIFAEFCFYSGLFASNVVVFYNKIFRILNTLVSFS